MPWPNSRGGARFLTTQSVTQEDEGSRVYSSRRDRRNSSSHKSRNEQARCIRTVHDGIAPFVHAITDKALLVSRLAQTRALRPKHPSIVPK